MKFSQILKGLLIGAELVSSAKIYSCTEKNTIALTFDDGPYQYTSELIDLLDNATIKATFFTNAENYWVDLPTDKTKQEVLKKMYSSGHQVASHTWAHLIPDTHEEIKSMMTKFDNFLESVIGVKPKYFRAPQGNCDDSCIQYFEELGYKVIQWDTDTNDWNKSDGADKRVKLVKEFLTEEWEKEKDNYLILMHDVQKHTVREIVPWIIRHAPFDKYKFVTVAECLGNKNDMYAVGNENSTTNIETNNNSTNTSSVAASNNNTANAATNNYMANASVPVNDNTTTDRNVVTDNKENVIPNDKGEDDKQQLLSSDATTSFKNVLFTVIIALISLYISYNLMASN